ncbi:MAG: FlgD immunoglobulin-like domain containing protein, partial [Treponemataceae bacterium]
APINYATDPAYLDLTLPEPSYPTAYGDYSDYVLLSSTPPVPPNHIAAAHYTHRLTDVLISVPPSSATDTSYFIWPIWARDSVTTEIAQADYETLTAAQSASQTVGLIRDFTGTQWLRDQNITVEARVNPLLGTPAAGRLHFDTNVSSTLLATSVNGPTGLWLPIFAEPQYSGLVTFPNGSTSTATGALVSGALWDFPIDSTDPKVKSVSILDFFFTLGAANATNPLYAARLNIATGASIPTDWYRRVLPFSFNIHDVTQQRGSVTILNNVINPNNGEITRVSYQLGTAGRATVQVFTLDGDLVKVLYRGNRAAGDYTASWDGKNMGGRSVARGIYFIRVVAPEIDEIRKVMVVK